MTNQNQEELNVKKYAPHIEKRELDDSHFYFVDGVFFPSVTRILNYAPIEYGLMQFFKNNSAEEIDGIVSTASARGTKIHEACERLLLGDTLQLHQEFPKRRDQKVLVGFKNWVARVQPEVLNVADVTDLKVDEEKTIEFTVASQKYKFAGTLDLMCKIDPDVIESITRESNQPIVKTKNPYWIIDFKATNYVGKSYFLQLLAYKQAVMEMTGIEPNVAILHLKPDYKAGYKFITDIRFSMTGRKYTPTIEDYMNIYKTYIAYHCGEVEDVPEHEVYPETLNLEK